VLYQQLAVLADTIDAHTAQSAAAAATAWGEPTGSMFHHLKTPGGRPPRDPTNVEGGWGLYLDAFTGRKKILLILAAFLLAFAITYSVVSWVSALR
jgi:hypothetical protein